MPVQAIPLALAASLYPLGIAALLLLTQAGRPRAKVVVFLAGAIACTLPLGFAVVFALHGAGLELDSKETARYGLRLAIGVLLMLAALAIARRPPRPHDGPSRVVRLAREGGLRAVFAASIVLYVLPSPVYLAALQVVGTSKLSTAAMAVWVVIVVALVLITVEVPVLLFLRAPDRTVSRLQAVDAWLSRNGHTLLVAVVGLIGLWVFIDGLAGLL
jgi:Sap-like sulfolipid-1-addressing protein